MAKFKGGSGPSAGTEIKNAIMTGVSWMLPFVIAGAVLMGIARIGASMYGIDNIWDGSHAQAASVVVQLLHKFDGFGGMALSLMLPVVAGYISFAIANKPGLAPGMADYSPATSAPAFWARWRRDLSPVTSCVPSPPTSNCRKRWPLPGRFSSCPSAARC